jgi:predicted ferric reductase
MKLHTRKLILIGMMLASYLPLILYSNFSSLQDSKEAIGFIGRLFGLTGILILTWQYLLGARGIIVKFIPDLIWLNNIHKFFGKYGFLLILMHPILIAAYYMQYQINVLLFNIESDFDVYVLYGKLAFGILFFIWITSAILREKLKFRKWKRIHFFVYLILPLALLHSYNIGLDLSKPVLRNYWILIAIIYIALAIYRILFSLGYLKLKYVITSVEKVGQEVVKITLKPVKKGIFPKPGQFIYFQPKRVSENHPFTVSHFNEDTKEISISPKALGPFTTMIHSLNVGRIVYIDGPYGVFTEEIGKSDKKIVLIAGGIGITPFLRSIERTQKSEIKNEMTLFYGNKSESDIAYKDFLETSQSENFKVIHILSNQENYQGEKGYIDMTILKKYLGEDLTSYDFYICGPPVMMKKLIAAFEIEKIPKESIHFEAFSL